MGMEKITHYWAAWITGLAILVASLAPSISAGLTNSTSNFVNEICSVTKPVLFSDVNQKNGDNSPSPSSKSSHLTHCPFCSTHGSLLGLPPTGEFVLPIIKTSNTLPLLFYQT